MRLCEECGVPKPNKAFNCDDWGFDVACKRCRGLFTKRSRPKPKDAPPKIRTESPHIIHIDALANMKNQPSKEYFFIVKEVGRDVVLVGQGKSFHNRLNQYRQCFFDDLVLLVAVPTKQMSVSRFHQQFEYCHAHENWYYYTDEMKAWIMLYKGTVV